MVETVKRIFLDPSRCIGCRSCVAACRECDSHKGESMIYIDNECASDHWQFTIWPECEGCSNRKAG